MALEGTLRDFSLADIFQLIGLQRKTGVLTLRNDREEARILFMNGMVVGADTDNQKLQNRLGRVLVKSNRITQAELEQALAIQGKTLQRLGQVLIQKGFIKREDLKESLQIQVQEIIYRLFRWIDGEYHFRPEPTVEYDQENFDPIGSESLLMQGVRMLDEWPMIERLIPDFDILVERTEKGRGLKLQMEKKISLESTLGESFDSLLMDVLNEDQVEIPQLEAMNLNHEQELVLRLINGPSIVQDLIDRSGLNEFETCRNLYDLIESGLVQRVTSQDYLSDVKVIEEEKQIPIWVPALLLAVIALLSFGLGWNPLNSYFPKPSELSSMKGQYEAAAQYQLHKVGQAIDLFYIRNMHLPARLANLTAEKLVKGFDLKDPLGRGLVYEVDYEANSYRLRARDRDGVSSDGKLLIEKAFATDTAAETLLE